MILFFCCFAIKLTSIGITLRLDFMALICVQHIGLFLSFRHTNWSDYFVFCIYLKNEASEANFDSKNPPQNPPSQKNFIIKKKN